MGFASWAGRAVESSLRGWHSGKTLARKPLCWIGGEGKAFVDQVEKGRPPDWEGDPQHRHSNPTGTPHTHTQGRSQALKLFILIIYVYECISAYLHTLIVYSIFIITCYHS